MKPLVFEGAPLIYPGKIKLLTKEEELAGLNEMIRMGWRCSTELYAEMLMTGDKIETV